MLVDRVLALSALCAALTLVTGDRALAGHAVPTSAEALFQRAQERQTEASLESRIEALQDLAAASRLAPDRPDILIAYGRACRESGQSANARRCFARASKLRPDDPEVWVELGAEWKDDWLLTTDRSSLREALSCYARATALSPDRAGPWCTASALLLLEGRPRDALSAALRARQADPEGLEPLLVLASSFYRLSVLVYADSAFRMARDRMPADLRERFDDESLLGAQPPNPAMGGTQSLEQTPWSGIDPDLTTPENEALLDYRTRLSLAVFLFGERGALRWDARADLFVRYGPPDAIQFNPARLGWGRELEVTYSRRRELTHSGEVDYGPGPNGFPFNMQVWSYSELGIRAVLIDQGLTHSYELRPSLEKDREDPRAPSGAVASHPELVSVGSGRGVFRALVPGVRPMQVAGSLSRFVVGDSTLILAHVSAMGSTTDSMTGSWAIIADDGGVERRGKAALSVSACDPLSERATTFAATVPPGIYRVDLAVATRDGRRGVVHRKAVVDSIPPGLVMSDLVLVCGAPSMAANLDAVRVEPNLSHEVTGSRVATAYFEVEHLVPSANGESRFGFHVSIRDAAEPDGAGQTKVLFDSYREETAVGSHRRQFLTAAIASLPPGKYELRVEVRDLVGGGTASGATDFVKRR